MTVTAAGHAPAVVSKSAFLAPLVVTLLALAGCGSAPPKPGHTMPLPGVKVPPRVNPAVPALPPANSGRGGYYKDDGPGDNPPPDLEGVPDADVKVEDPLPRANRPYVVFGKTYTPISGDEPFIQEGYASWYGKKFHGQRTSSGERYDMYKMTAAHPTLPIPSYIKLTDIDSGKQIVVRVNDRGPFHSNRIVDISYTAALKLGMLGKGSHKLRLERLLTADIVRMQAAKRDAQNVPAIVQARADEAAPVAPAAAAPVVPASAGPAADLVASQTAAPSAAVVSMMDGGPGTGAVSAPETTVLPNVAATAERATDQQLDAARGGLYLQLGAYSHAANAESARAALAPYAGRLGLLQVVQAGAIFRLYSGPFRTRLDANQAAATLPSSLNLKPIAVLR